MRGGDEIEARLHEAEHRGDSVAGAGDVVGHAADEFDIGGVEADFLLRLAQSGGFGVGVLGVDASAGEADLSGVLVQVRGALGQQDAGFGAQHDRHQHRRFHQGALERIGGIVQARREDFVRRVRSGQPGEAGAQFSHGHGLGPGYSSPSGNSPRLKNFPWLHTPSICRPLTHSGTASATSS